MDGGGSQDNAEMAIEHEKTALYDNDPRLIPELKQQFREAGISEHVKELLWNSEKTEKDPSTGDISVEGKVALHKNYTDILEKIDQGELTKEQKDILKANAGGYAVQLKVDGRDFQEVFAEAQEIIDTRESAKKSAEEGELGEAREKFGVGTEEDMEPHLLLQKMQEDPEATAPENKQQNIEKLKLQFAQQGISKDALTAHLETTTLDTETKAAILHNYVPLEKDDIDPEATSPESEQRLDDLVAQAQEQTKEDLEFDEDVPEEERAVLRHRFNGVKGMLSRFNEKYDGKPERFGKLGLKIGAGIAMAFILFLLWELHKINDLAGKKK